MYYIVETSNSLQEVFMQKFITAVFAIILLGGGILFIWSFVQKQNTVVVVSPQLDQLVNNQVQKNEVDFNDINDTDKMTIPEALKEQLTVTDITVRETSIADNPVIWKAFIDSEIGISDPTFILGCEEYLDTGGKLIKNLFRDEANQIWVADIASDQLIGIGQLTIEQYQLIQDYLQLDKEIACLALSNAVYSDYHLYSSRVELLVQPGTGGDEGFYSYALTVLVNNTYLTLPGSIAEQLDNSTGAGREPVLVANRFIIGLGEYGINFFDLTNWELVPLFGMHYDGVRGVSKIYTFEDEPLIAFAHENWEGDPAFGAVYIYDLAEGKEYKQYMRNAELGWMMGANEIFSLENSADLEFLDKETLRIVEYPNFDEDVTNGDDPYEGETEILEWNFLQK